MSAASQVDPHDKMRARDVNKVARGEQAPRPAYEYGSIKQAPPKPTSSKRNHNGSDNNNDDQDDEINKMVEPGTAPLDSRFPCTNQTRHCYARYIEYQKRNRSVVENDRAYTKPQQQVTLSLFYSQKELKRCLHCGVDLLIRCIQKKGKNALDREKFARYYRSLCPSEWIERWNEQIEKGIFPGPV